MGQARTGRLDAMQSGLPQPGMGSAILMTDSKEREGHPRSSGDLANHVRIQYVETSSFGSLTECDVYDSFSRL